MYSLENSKLIFSRTIGYRNGSLKKFDTFLKVFYKIRFSTILAGFLLESNIIGNNKLFNSSDSYLIRLILNIKCSLNFIFFCYEFIYLKNNNDYLTLMIYSAVDLSVFLLDFINHLIIFINIGIINFFIRKKYAKIQKLLDYF